MKPGVRRRRMAALLGAALTMTVGLTTLAPSAEAASRTHYVDCTAPAQGDGTVDRPWNSVEAASAHRFEPGDHLLLRRGVTCSGRLQPQGDGADGNPIVIGAYGTGSARAAVDGAGKTEAAVELIDQSWWTVRDLEVTNRSSTRDLRTGVRVQSKDPKDKAGIVLENLYVHHTAGWGDKSGSDAAKYAQSAGISILTPSSGDVGDGGPINGILIRNNRLHDTGGGGIKISKGPRGKYHTAVRITGNRMDRVGGDGIVVHASDGPLIDRNVATDLGLGAYPFEGGNFAGMWPINSRNPVFEHNVVTRSTPSVHDSTAWDCDGAIVGTCTYRYNYSQGNAGGFALNCLDCTAFGDSTARQVYRGNISQDDCRFEILEDSPLELTNNTFWCTSEKVRITWPETDKKGQATVRDNVFVAAHGSFPTSPFVTYDNNLYHGGVTPPSTDAKAHTSDPRFAAPGTADDTLASARAAYRPTPGSAVLRRATGGGHLGADQRSAVARKPYADLKAAYNNVGISPDENTDVGGLSTSGRSFSAEALAQQGLRPGGPVSTQGTVVPWTAAAAGHPDNVKAAGQTIRLEGKGRRLVVLATATNGAYSGRATVTYADGTTQRVELSVDDWWDPSSGAGSTPVATTTYQNQARTTYHDPSTGRLDRDSTVYSLAVRLTNRPVRSITLPKGNPLATAGLHVFSMSVVSR